MHDSEMSAEELQSILWDILEECINGRTEGHRCPWCPDAGDLVIQVEEDVKVRMECHKCRKFFEAQIR